MHVPSPAPPSSLVFLLSSPSPSSSSSFYRDENLRRVWGSAGKTKFVSFRFAVGTRGRHPRMSSYNMMARFAAMRGTLRGVSLAPGSTSVDGEKRRRRGIHTPHDRPDARNEVHDSRLDSYVASRPGAEGGVVGCRREVYYSHSRVSFSVCPG